MAKKSAKKKESAEKSDQDQDQKPDTANTPEPVEGTGPVAPIGANVACARAFPPQSELGK